MDPKIEKLLKPILSSAWGWLLAFVFIGAGVCALFLVLPTTQNSTTAYPGRGGYRDIGLWTWCYLIMVVAGFFLFFRNKIKDSSKNSSRDKED